MGDRSQSPDEELSADTNRQEIGFLEGVQIIDEAEDVKTVRCIDVRGTADVTVTDDSMGQLLEASEQVFDDIHADMAELHDLFHEIEQPREVKVDE